MRARIVRALPEHVPHVAAGMRQADRDECLAWSGRGPEAALRMSLAGSHLAWTGLLDGEPACMFGAGAETLLAPIASPWMLGTDAVDRAPMAVARLSRVALGWMAEAYPVLANWSDARHVRAHGWLRWLGFSLGEARPMGTMGLPFRPFAMRCRDV